MSYNLFVDDERDPSDVYPREGVGDYYQATEFDDAEWVVARSYTEVRRILKERGVPRLVSFDYVLGRDPNWDSPKTGADCAVFLMAVARRELRDADVPYETADDVRAAFDYAVHSDYPGAHLKIDRALGVRRDPTPSTS